MREDEIEKAVRFLRSDKLKTTPLARKKTFLEEKLSKEELDEALKRYNEDPSPVTDTSNNTAGATSSESESSSTWDYVKGFVGTTASIALGGLISGSMLLNANDSEDRRKRNGSHRHQHGQNQPGAEASPYGLSKSDQEAFKISMLNELEQRLDEKLNQMKKTSQEDREQLKGDLLMTIKDGMKAIQTTVAESSSTTKSSQNEEIKVEEEPVKSVTTPYNNLNLDNDEDQAKMVEQLLSDRGLTEDVTTTKPEPSTTTDSTTEKADADAEAKMTGMNYRMLYENSLKSAESEPKTTATPANKRISRGALLAQKKTEEKTEDSNTTNQQDKEEEEKEKVEDSTATVVAASVNEGNALVGNSTTAVDSNETDGDIAETSKVEGENEEKKDEEEEVINVEEAKDEGEEDGDDAVVVSNVAATISATSTVNTSLNSNTPDVAEQHLKVSQPRQVKSQSGMHSVGSTVTPVSTTSTATTSLQSSTQEVTETTTEPVVEEENKTENEKTEETEKLAPWEVGATTKNSKKKKGKKRGN
eukprot:CAMPEP_0115035742 /NCGR_PEP_ID=MMETSP0216-20121206/41668_1 /TAXON_ID=223996 /ORGANISM="Protocruzia adherens, Strain Boccale" /LENGTH=530 /DNA_ID=CAMNT_0002415357 /DNA_START=87 /DNA_END=1679 /DNA_ORIENTATION=-